MTIATYQCPSTGLSVDRRFAPADNRDTYEIVACRACNSVHLVNVATGRVLMVNVPKLTGVPAFRRTQSLRPPSG
jgi:hypothetical protein